MLSGRPQAGAKHPEHRGTTPPRSVNPKSALPEAVVATRPCFAMALTPHRSGSFDPARKARLASPFPSARSVKLYNNSPRGVHLSIGINHSQNKQQTCNVQPVTCSGFDSNRTPAHAAQPPPGLMVIGKGGCLKKTLTVKVSVWLIAI